MLRSLELSSVTDGQVEVSEFYGIHMRALIVKIQGNNSNNNNNIVHLLVLFKF